MRISYCIDCNKKIENKFDRGGLLQRCPKHKKQRKRETDRKSHKKWRENNPVEAARQLREWYVKARQNNPIWAAENKRRAKAWRRKNKDHIRLYKQQYALQAAE